MYRDSERLYEIARRITTEAGFDYYHPVTGKMTPAVKRVPVPAVKSAKPVKPKAKAKKAKK